MPHSAHRPETPLCPPPGRRPPPSAALISAIVRFGDLRSDLGQGHVLIRLSAAKSAQAVVIEALGGDYERASEIGIVWNEIEDQLVRVQDEAQVKRNLAVWWEEYFDRYDRPDPCRLAA